MAEDDSTVTDSTILSRVATLTQRITQTDDVGIEIEAADSGYDTADVERGPGALHNIRSRIASRPDQTVIQWEKNDPENPYNWSNLKKITIIVLVSCIVENSNIGTSLPSMAVPYITAHFGITSSISHVLPVSIYMVGYVIGPILWGPISEQFGRRNITLLMFSLFFIFTLACAVAPTWNSLLVFRFFCGVCSSSPIVVAPGVMADLYNNPKARGWAFNLFSIATVFGPLFSPIISGFSAPVMGWRWTFWIGLIIIGVTWIFGLVIPETFGPVLLARRAAKLRKEKNDPNIVAPRDLEPVNLLQLFRVVLTRPIRMLIFEPIVAACCAYIALAYGIFYMSFEAFPLIFQDLYGLRPGYTGLIYLWVGFGACLNIPVALAWDKFLESPRGETWRDSPELRRLPLACLGGPLFTGSLFWLGWTARHSVPFEVTMLGAIPFGMGYVMIWMQLTNYLTDAYEIFAASANAASSCTRSLLAVLLPLATTPMFKRLGIAGACSLLGGLTALMCAIPFVFIWQGANLRARSPFCVALQKAREEKRRQEERLGLEKGVL